MEAKVITSDAPQHGHFSRPTMAAVLRFESRKPAVTLLASTAVNISGLRGVSAVNGRFPCSDIPPRPCCFELANKKYLLRYMYQSYSIAD